MTNKKILIINGPNLNLLEKGSFSLWNRNPKRIRKKLNSYVKNKKAKLAFYQSNSEGEIINFIQKIFNPGCYYYKFLYVFTYSFSYK